MTMSFHDLQVDLAEERIERLRRDADRHRLVTEARRARARRRRLGLWRKVIAPGLAATVQGINDVVGAIVSPAWPTADTPPRPIRPSPGR
ncbi:MAG TPA: hypothetical protein VFA46_10505 [Actinomycetes bacterium]|jgi:hypothetical protein|nr:hypothetical protein [Actinomycetes bacterium]